MPDDRRQETLIQWIEAYRALIYKIVRSYARSHHDQQDLFQEIVSQIWRAIPGYAGEAKESSYVYKVALFAALAWSRKERRRKDRIEFREGGLELFQAEVESDPRLDWLYERIGELEDVDRSLCLMMLDGFNYREIADVLGLTEGNVGVKLTRVRQKFIEIVERENEL